LIAACRTLQLQGSPELIADARGSTGHNPFYNIDSASQPKPQVRYGFSVFVLRYAAFEHPL